LAKSLIFKKHLHTALTVGLAIAYHPLQYLISGLFSLQIIPPDGYGSGYYSGVGELGVVIVVAGKAYSIIAANEDHLFFSNSSIRLVNFSRIVINESMPQQEQECKYYFSPITKKGSQTSPLKCAAAARA
jgi:hypothetical protein